MGPWPDSPYCAAYVGGRHEHGDSQQGGYPENPLLLEPLKGQDLAVFPGAGLKGTGAQRGEREVGIGHSAWGQGGYKGPSGGGTGDKAGEAGPEAHFPCSYGAHTELLDSLPASQPACRTRPSLGT